MSSARGSCAGWTAEHMQRFWFALWHSAFPRRSNPSVLIRFPKPSRYVLLGRIALCYAELERGLTKGADMAESKRQLARALEQLMEQKPLDQVRVSEIVALAGVSKQTFYHHFTDKYHLMEYCFRDMFSQQFDRMGTLAPFGECYAEFLDQCRQRKTFLRNGFTSQDVNSLYRVMHHALRDAYGKRVRVYGVADEGAVGFCLDFFSKGCAGCTRHWFDQGMDFSNEQLVELISLCIPAGVAKYFQ